MELELRFRRLDGGNILRIEKQALFFGYHKLNGVGWKIPRVREGRFEDLVWRLLGFRMGSC